MTTPTAHAQITPAGSPWVEVNTPAGTFELTVEAALDFADTVRDEAHKAEEMAR